jgi:hypothetical protein
MNFVIGWTADDKPAEWAACKTGKGAKAYLDRTYPWLDIPLESAERLVKQRVNTSMQVRIPPRLPFRGNHVSGERFEPDLCWSGERCEKREGQNEYSAGAHPPRSVFFYA